MTVKVREVITLNLDGAPVQVMVSHVADSFGLIELQRLDMEGINFIMLTEDEIERSRIPQTWGDAKAELYIATEDVKLAVTEALRNDLQWIGKVIIWLFGLCVRVEGPDQ